MELKESLRWSYQRLVDAEQKNDSSDVSVISSDTVATSSNDSGSEVEERGGSAGKSTQQRQLQSTQRQQQRQQPLQRLSVEVKTHGVEASQKRPLSASKPEQQQPVGQQKHNNQPQKEIKRIDSVTPHQDKPKTIEQQNSLAKRQHLLLPVTQHGDQNQQRQKQHQAEKDSTEISKNENITTKENRENEIITTKEISKNENITTKAPSNGAAGMGDTLKDLQNSITAISPSKFSDTASHIAYTLSELLQGFGNPVAEELEIVSPAATKINNNIQSEPSLPNASAEYRSPLALFKSYRLNPKFSSNISIGSSTISNVIKADMTFCQHDLLGRCNDSSCTHTHIDKVATMSKETLVRDLLSYQVSGTVEDDVRKRYLDLNTNKYMEKYKDVTYEHMKEFCNANQKEMSGEVVLDPRVDTKLSPDTPEISENFFNVEYFAKQFDNQFEISLKAESKGRRTENQEIRYFSKKYNSIDLLKARLGENPSDVKLWISLVHRILSAGKKNSLWSQKPNYNIHLILVT